MRFLLIFPALLGLVFWVRGRWWVVTVVGESMVPTLVDGQQVLARRVRSGAALRAGQVIIFRLPPELERAAQADGDVVYRVKRIAAVGGDPAPSWLRRDGLEQIPAKHFSVMGDAPTSESSLHLGLVPADRILGWLPGR